MANGDPPISWQQYGATLTTNQLNWVSTTTSHPVIWESSGMTQAGPPRRGQPRHIAIVWLERADEPIPPPWTGCVAHRFFDHATATFGVIVESDAIPWTIQPGAHLITYPSWEALDLAIRQDTLAQVAQVLPRWEQPPDDSKLK
mgnify:FL=1